MKKWLNNGAVVLALALPTATLLAAEEGRTAHREVAVKSTAEACAILERDGKVLRQLLRKAQLDGVDLHNIHMLSYSLKEAVHQLRADWEKVANEVEELHENSESGNAEKTRVHGRAFLQELTAALCGRKGK